MIDLLVCLLLISITIVSVFAINAYCLRELRYLENAGIAHNLLNMMTSRLNTNLNAETLSTYQAQGSTALFLAANCKTECETNEIAQSDVRVWTDNVVRSLPNSGYSISLDINNVLTVAIKWLEPHAASDGTPDACGFGDLRTGEYCIATRFKVAL